MPANNHILKKEELIQLALKYSENKCTPQEKEAVENFFFNMQDINKELSSELPEEKKDRILKKIYHNVNGPVRKKKKLFYKTASIAAAFIGIIGIAFFSSLFLVNQEKMVTQATAKGEKREIYLQDGSTVFLNSNSSITYPENFQEQRNLQLKGEAFFNVKRNPDKPFTITTGEVQTTVLGTSFNIHAYKSNNIEVSVNTGKVEVSRKKRAEKVILKKNQQAHFKDNLPPLVSSGNSDEFNAWKENIIILNNTSLGKTAKILENWYDVQIEFDREELKELGISGKFKDEKLENVLESISIINQVEIEYINKKQILIRRKPENSN